MLKSSAPRAREKKRIVTIDLDMTIADHRKRLRAACRDGLIDRDILFAEELIAQDRVIAGAVDALSRIRRNYRIIFLSSRTKRVTGATKKWLRRHKLFKAGDRLIVVNSEKERWRIFGASYLVSTRLLMILNMTINLVGHD